MPPLLRRLVASRLLAELRLVASGAAIGAVTGVAVSALAAVRLDAPTALDRVTVAVSGLGYGFWGGLCFTAGLALAARRATPQPPVSSLVRAVVVAACVTAALTMLAMLAGLATIAAVAVGVVAGTVAARLAFPAVKLP